VLAIWCSEPFAQSTDRSPRRDWWWSRYRGWVVTVTSWESFVQRVRRHRPSELLAAIAVANIEIAPEGWYRPGAGSPIVFPWGLAAAARESIQAGNEHRASGVTMRDLAQICSIYGNLYDPLYDDRDQLAYFVRVAYEQFPFQESLFFGMARSRLLFGRPSPFAYPKLRVVDGAFWERTIGLPLERLFAAGMLFGVGALKNAGRFDLSWYGQPNFVQVRDILSPEQARDAMSGVFAASIAELKANCPPARGQGLEKLAFNPLQARPFVRLDENAFLAPVPTFVFWRASAPALYYVALDQLAEADKPAFTGDVGTLFEDYVARQAEQLRAVSPSPPEVYREIEYRTGAHTSDVILVWPDFILIVEAKATRLTEESRLGGSSLSGEIERAIGKAVHQIEITTHLIASGDTALAHIPSDCPVYGLVVTLEPYHFVQVDDLSSRPSLPVAIGSISDFERFIADCLVTRRSEAELARYANAHRTSWDLSQLVNASTGDRFSNPMLDDEHKELVTLAFGTQPSA
jgi:hypothetical protein